MLDLLAFGAHPDDVEAGAGGILATHALKGYSCGIIDITAGEMASNGTVPQRQAEAREAAGILKCTLRECMGLPDAHLSTAREALYQTIALLRRLQPKIVLAPFPRGDRHPDHNAAGEIVSRVVYLSGLRRLPVEGKPFRPQQFYYYLLSTDCLPDAIVDISAVYECKEMALNAHCSQFGQDRKESVDTLVNNPSFRRYVRSRDAYFGSQAGVAYGEGLVFRTKPLIDDLINWSGIV